MSSLTDATAIVVANHNNNNNNNTGKVRFFLDMMYM